MASNDQTFKEHYDKIVGERFGALL